MLLIEKLNIFTENCRLKKKKRYRWIMETF